MRQSKSRRPRDDAGARQAIAQPGPAQGACNSRDIRRLRSWLHASLVLFPGRSEPDMKIILVHGVKAFGIGRPLRGTGQGP